MVNTYLIFKMIFEKWIELLPKKQDDKSGENATICTKLNVFFFFLQVYILFCADSPYEVDRISFDLPMMKQMGDSIHMEVKSVRPYEAFYDDLKKMASS